MLTNDERDALVLVRKWVAAGLAHCESSALRAVAQVSPAHAAVTQGLETQFQTALKPCVTFNARLWQHTRKARTGAQIREASLLWLDVIIATGDIDVFNKETTPWSRQSTPQ